MPDFVTEFTIKEDEDEGPTSWMKWEDGMSNQHAGRVGVILQSLEGDLVKCAVCNLFLATNNEAKYEAVLIGLDLAKAVRASSIVIHNNSQVIIGHINEDFEAKREQM